MIFRYFWIFLSLFFLDIASKSWVLGNIPPLQGGGYPFGGVPIFQNFLGISFSLNYVINTGAAWGLFSNYAGILFLVRFLIIAALSVYVYRSKGKIQTFPFLLVLTGAVSNAIDYLLYGHVIDFFHFVFWGYSFPIFNLADSYISLGVFCLVFFSSFRSKVLKDA